MKLLASALAVSAGFASLLQVTVARTLHENNAKSHIKRSHDLQKRGAFSGRATYFADGLGACGGTNGPNDMIVSLNHEQFGSGGDCYKPVIITGNGKTHSAVIVDECMGCDWGSLDMSEGLFQQFASLDMGTFSITWDFDDGSDSTTTTTSKAKPTPTTTWTPPTTSRTSTTRTTPTTTSVSTTSTTSRVVPSSSSVSSSSSTSTFTSTTTSDTSTPTSDAPESDQTATQSDDAGGNYIADQQMLVYILGNMASYGKSVST